MTEKQYKILVEETAPRSPIRRDCLAAFLVGGIICTVGQALAEFWKLFGLAETESMTAASLSLIVISGLLTGLSMYDNIAGVAGAGTLVPITGFANSISAAAIEYRTEGLIMGVGAKMFTIAGPVIVYGTAASVIYGFIYWIFSGI